MKLRLLNAIALLLVVVMLCVANAPVNSDFNLFSADEVEEKSQVITVANIEEGEIDVNQVYASRFLNMLNHNYVYNDSFKSVEDIVNDSMPALIKFRENEDDEYIAEQFVTDYVFNMYGVEIFDYSEINAEFEQIEGFVYILPRGFALYEHEIASISENEDGSFTVKTNVTISSHDSGNYTDVCETLFVRNELSQFGFSIIRSVIGGEAIAA